MATPVSLIPAPIGEMIASLLSEDTVYTDYVYGYDFALGGLPFVSAASGENPIRRKSIPVEKPRTDDSPEPGEQTFGNWWVKAQSSFHGGAGLKYTDSSGSFDRIRFRNGTGVDVWTPGQVKLLHGMESVLENAEAGKVAVIRDTTDGAAALACVTNAGFTVREATYSVDGNGVDQVSYGSVDTDATATDPLSICTDGTTVYYLLADGVYKLVLTSNSLTSTRIYVGTFVSTDLIGFVKGRLVLCDGPAVYELNQSAGTDTALPTAKFTHTTVGWAWTAIADGPNAIYLAGNVGDSGAIYKFVLDTSGLFPTLTSGMVACELPTGEQVTAMHNYVGYALAVATNAGLRFGGFDGSNVVLGPLTIDHNDQIGTVGSMLTSYSKYVYVSYTDEDGYAGAARVDMSMMLTDSPYRYVQENIFAWAPDVLYEDSTNGFETSATVTGLTVLDGNLVIGVSGQGVAHVHPSRLRPSGKLYTSRIRMGTLEDKNARFVRVRAENGYGYIGYGIGYESDTSFTAVATMTLDSARDSGDVALTSDPSGWMTLRFTLTAHDTREDYGPIMSGYQLKCVPSVAKQRRYQIPVWVFDQEVSRTGQNLPYLGRAIDRIRAVETVESSGGMVEFATLAQDGIERERVLIEDVDFIQTKGPFENQGFGGLLVLTMKTVR